MRRSTRFAPFSRPALMVAISALGLTAVAPAAHAADLAKPAPDKAAVVTPAPATKAPATPTAGAVKAGAAAEKPAPVKAAPAPDKKTKDAARKAYGEGEKAYTAGDFAGAYAGYAKANSLIPSAQAAYWAAKSLDQQAKSEEAIKSYEALLADPGVSKLGEDKLSDAQTRLAMLKAAQLGEVTVSAAAPGARLSVDGVAKPGPLPLSLKLSPGPHRLALTAEGYEAKDLDVQVQAGTKVEQNVELAHVAPPPPPPAPVAEVAPAPPPPPPPAEKHSNVPAYVTLGIAAGGVAVGTIFGVQALQAKSDYNGNPTTKHADDTERNALIADMAFGVAITLGVTGIVLLTSSDDAAEAPKAAKLHLPPKGTFRVLPYVGRESGGAAARLTF